MLKLYSDPSYIDFTSLLNDQGMPWDEVELRMKSCQEIIRILWYYKSQASEDSILVD